LTTFVGLTPQILVSLGVRAATAALRLAPQHSVHTVITNVPGPQLPLYALGRRMLEVLPCVPITQGVRVGVAVLSYNGRISFGTTGDFDTVREVSWFCGRIEAGLAELCERAQTAAQLGRPSSAKCSVAS
jgi:diacylglycerol O-acyltransferase